MAKDHVVRAEAKAVSATNLFANAVKALIDANELLRSGVEKDLTEIDVLKERVKIAQDQLTSNSQSIDGLKKLVPSL
jgi:hypothetical protein